MLVYVFPLPKIEIFVNFILTHAWGKTYTTYTNIHQPPLVKVTFCANVTFKSPSDRLRRVRPGVPPKPLDKIGQR
jgi:hypothetical protein